MENIYLDMIENLCSLNGKLEAIIESNTNGIVEVDQQGNILNCNPSYCSLFHLRQDLLKGEKIFHCLGNNEISKDIKNIMKEGNVVYFKEFIVELGSCDEYQEKKLVELKMIPIPHGDGVNFVGIFKDKSDVLIALENREKFITSLLNLVEDIKVDNRNTIYHLASLVELRDHVTGLHLQRVENFTRVLATEYFNTYHKRDPWVTEGYVEDMAISAVLHDIGKVGISDTILLKPTQLSDMERNAMKEHTMIAGKALEKHRGKKDFLSMGREIALTHHERWDGSGYPRNLEGDSIPLSGRIVALCDTYDAITNDRPYKRAMSHYEAVDIIMSEKGRAFDPEIVDLFLKIHPFFEKINLDNQQ